MNLENIKKGVLGLAMGAALISAEEAEAQTAGPHIDRQELRHERKNNTELLSSLRSYYQAKFQETSDSLKSFTKTDLSPEEIIIKEAAFGKELSVYQSIIKKPEVFYHNTIAEIKLVKEELKKHFSSPEFVARLSNKNIQTKLLNNLDSARISLVHPAFLDEQSLGSKDKVIYSDGLNEVLISYEGAKPYEIQKALLNCAYHEGVSAEEAVVLKKDFRRDNNSSEARNDRSANSFNRMICKKMLDLEMKKFGIKYGAKFTKEDYREILRHRHNNEFDEEINSLIDTSTETQLIDLMNALADSNNKTVGNYNQA